MGGRAFGRLLFIAILIMFSVCGTVLAGEKLRMSGAGSGIQVLKLLSDAYSKENHDVAFELLPDVGSSGGINAVLGGRLDIAVLSSRLSEDEKKQGITEEIYGSTPLVFAANSTVPDTGFTINEVADIYAQRKKTWKDGDFIRLVLRPRKETITQALMDISPAMQESVERAAEIQGVFVGVTDQEAATYTEKTYGSFGAMALCVAVAEKRDVKLMAIDGVAPTVENMAMGKYPYKLDLSLAYMHRNYAGAVKKFLDFVHSPAGGKIIAETGHRLALGGGN